MHTMLGAFAFKPDGITTLADALLNFLKSEIVFGRIKGGEKLPSISEIAKDTGLSFHQARSVVEQLAREGYVHSRPHIGTVVLMRGKNMLRGRVLIAIPDVDVCRYYPIQMIDSMRRKLSPIGYMLSVVSFPLDPDGSLDGLKSELSRTGDFVIAFRATPNVQRYLAESGVKYALAYGEKPLDDSAVWIPFSPEEALSHFADHCVRAGIKQVTQVRFEGNEMIDASPALSEKGVESSWLTLSRTGTGRCRFDGIMRCAYETFEAVPRRSISDLLLFWNAFAAQGAMMAFLKRDLRIPEDVKIVSLFEVGFGPVYTKSITRLENDPIAAGERIAEFVLAVFAKGRMPKPPVISPQYVFGETFPF